jgi:hypothetical protein
MSRMTYMRSWKSLRLTSHTWLGLNPQIGRPLSRIVVPLVYLFFFVYFFLFTIVMKVLISCTEKPKKFIEVLDELELFIDKKVFFDEKKIPSGKFSF